MSNYGIIFDCDGTLVDSLSATLTSFHYAIMQVEGKERSSPEITKYFGRAADFIFINVLGDEEKGLLAFSHFKEHQALQTLHLHEGIAEMLENIIEQKIPMGIVTGRHSDDLEIMLRPHGISKHFVTMITDNQLKQPKPSPEGILLAASKMGLNPGNTLYVGDSPMDIQAARAAGATSVAALWDLPAERSVLENEHPDFLAERPEDVLRIFKEFVFKG